MLSENDYYRLTDEMRHGRGQMPFNVKTDLMTVIKNNNNLIPFPATEDEVKSVLYYLNNCKNEEDDIWMFNVKRYKDCLFCKKYMGDEWILFKRDPDEQLWDLYDALCDCEDRKDYNYTTVKIIKKIV